MNLAIFIEKKWKRKYHYNDTLKTSRKLIDVSHLMLNNEPKTTISMAEKNKNLLTKEPVY